MRKALSHFLVSLPLVLSAQGYSKKVQQEAKKEYNNLTKIDTTAKKESETSKTAKLQIGKQVPDLPQNSNQLALVKSGDSWTQKDLSKKLALIFYVAPSEKDLNRHVTDLIKSANLNKKHYSSFAIINMKASSWPNWVLSWKLNASQKEFATTTYIKDYERVLVDKWGLKDHSNDVVLVKDGKVLFVHRGKLSVEKSKELLTMLKQEVAKAEQLTHKKVENKKTQIKKAKA